MHTLGLYSVEYLFRERLFCDAILFNEAHYYLTAGESLSPVRSVSNIENYIRKVFHGTNHFQVVWTDGSAPNSNQLSSLFNFY